MLDAILSWQTFGVALLVFGFAPGALLRLIVLAFRRDDPRRSELRAELYAVPRAERPFWVLEQLEVALFEGLWPRIATTKTRRRRGARKLAATVSACSPGVIVAWTSGASFPLTLIYVMTMPAIVAFLTHPGPHRGRRMGVIIASAILVAGVRSVVA